MNSDTTESTFPTSSSMDSTTTGSSGMGSSSLGAGGMGSTGMGSGSMGQGNGNTVQRMAQKAHQTVDRLEQTIGSGSETVMGWQQEYGEMAREQVKANPLAAVGVAFGVGILFSKLFMR